ncbi:MAG: hypothetical protein LBB81_07205 [Treponema sp.]|jgi:hypothetical protein|nr:hypothetical protein [Treponema sp.]
MANIYCLSVKQLSDFPKAVICQKRMYTRKTNQIFIFSFIVSFFIFTTCAGNSKARLSASEANTPPSKSEFNGVLEVYPGLGNNLYRSPLYAVEVWNGEDWLDSYTYYASRGSVTNWHKGGNPSVSFTTFGTTTEIHIRLRGLRNNIRSVQISPKAKNIDVQISNGIAQFKLSMLDKVWVIINNNDSNPLFICADPPKPEIPPDAVYFGPGVHETGQLFKPKNDQTIYLDGGAWVKGNFDIRGLNNIKIIGPGVLSGEMWRGETLRDMAWEKTREYFMIWGDIGAQNTGNHLEGVTIVNTPGYCTFGGLNVIRNVKLLSPWFWSTDGFYVMPDRITRQGLIEDCLAFIGDDVFFPRDNVYGDITIRNCLAGTTNNNVFCMSYWPQSLANNYFTRVENIDIKTYNEHAVFQSILDGSASNAGMGIHNQVYKDIRIEGNIPCPLIRIENRPYPWGGDARSPVLGTSGNIQFINITLEGSQQGKSRILGKDADNGHSGYLFENVRIGGKLVEENNFGAFFNINKFVYDITVR